MVPLVDIQSFTITLSAKQIEGNRTQTEKSKIHDQVDFNLAKLYLYFLIQNVITCR